MKKAILTSLITFFTIVTSLQAQDPVMEFGRVTINHNWATITFVNAYTDPVVVAGPPTRNGGHKSIVRIQNVTPTSCQIRIQEWDYHDQWHMFEDVSFLVVERGRHTMPNGTVLESGSIDLSNEKLSLKEFSAALPSLPAVFGSIVSNNDATAITHRLKNVATGSFNAKMQEEEANDGLHAAETFNFIAMEKFAGTIGDYEYVVGTEMINHKPTTIEGLEGYENFFADMQTLNGGNTASVRMTGTPEELMNLYIQEEKSLDNETWHLHEEVAYLVFRPINDAPVIYTVTFESTENGTISGDKSQDIVEGGSTTEVTAVANDGYLFDKWSDNSTENPRVIDNITGTLAMIAYFKVDDTGTPEEPVIGSVLSQTFDHSNFNRRDTLTYGDGTTWQYTYDALGNLEAANKTHASDPAQDLLYSYTYDSIGNRLTASEAGVSKTYISNELNQYDSIQVDADLAEQLIYDEDGNPLTNGDWDLFWDAEDRLKRMEHKTEDVTIEFKYDYRGFRGEKLVTTNGIITKHIAYIYDGNLVSAEVNVLNGQQKLIRKYTYGLDPAGTKQQVGGIGALVGMESFDDNGESNKFHMVSDAGGNVVQVLLSEDDGTLGLANTYEYSPFGSVISKVEAVENPMQYNSKYTDDETGLVYYGFRYYDAKDGRWLNQDPIGVNGGINTYNSVSNNMVNGFAGGMSWFGGMNGVIGDLDHTKRVDAYGLWEYADEAKRETRFVKSESGDTIKKLALMRGLDEKEFKKWLTFVNNSVKGADGQNYTISSITKNTKLAKCQQFKVPNISITFLGEFTKSDHFVWNLWSGNFNQPQSIFSWAEDFINERNEQSRKDGYKIVIERTAAKIPSAMRSLSKKKQLAIVRYFGHGVGTGGALGPDNGNTTIFPAKYSTYGLNEMDLIACAALRGGGLRNIYVNSNNDAVDPVANGTMNGLTTVSPWRLNVSKNGYIFGYRISPSAATAESGLISEQGLSRLNDPTPSSVLNSSNIGAQ